MCLLQQLELRRVKDKQRRISTDLQELSSKYATLLAVAEARNAENARLHRETAELLRLRNEVTQLKKRLAANSNNGETKEDIRDSAHYLKRDQISFVGFDSPENAVQSWRWALMKDDYTNFIAALAPQLQQEELAKPNSRSEFNASSFSNKHIEGMQVLSAKPLSSDRTEVKVRFDTENTAFTLILPMVLVGNEWKLGDEIQSYTKEWDGPANAQ